MKSFKDYLPENEILCGGTSACAGCGALIGLRHALYVLGDNTIVCNPACCMTLINYFDKSCMNCSWIHTAFECMGSTASGIRHSLDAQGKDMNVVVYAGDGGTADIGMQSLSHAAYCDEDIIYIEYDNNCYGNTGGQWSSQTMTGASTKTKINSNMDIPKNMEKIMASTNPNAYIATANISYPVDFMNKVEKAKNHKGFSFIHLIVPCVTNWIFETQYTIEIGKLTDKCGAFPLFEIENRILTLSKKYDKLEHVDKWTSSQGRFKTITPEAKDKLQTFVNERMAELKERNGKVFV